MCLEIRLDITTATSYLDFACDTCSGDSDKRSQCVCNNAINKNSVFFLIIVNTFKSADRRAERLCGDCGPIVGRQSEAIRFAGRQGQSGSRRRSAECQRARSVRSATRRSRALLARGKAARLGSFSFFLHQSNPFIFKFLCRSFQSHETTMWR